MKSVAIFDKLIKDRGATNFVEGSSGMKKFKILREFLSKETYPKNKILDAGGTDFTFKILGSIFPAAKIYSLDKHKDQIRNVSNKIIFDLNKKIKIKSKFDIIFCGDVLQHLDPDAFIQNMGLVLDRNGLLIITIPNLASWINRIFVLVGYSPNNYDVSKIKKVGNPFVIDAPFYHRTAFTCNGAKEFFEYSGFELIYRAGFSYTEEFDVFSGKRQKLRTVRRLADAILPVTMKEGLFLVFKKDHKLESDGENSA